MREGAASVTAQRVAAHRLGFPRAAVAFGDPAADERLARDVAAGVVGGRSPMAAYLEARTAFFDRVVVRALDRGVSQVVVTAAGYDGRALRYAKPGVSWFEVDHPDTQADKRRRLDRLGIDAAHVAFVAADFTVDDVDAGLAHAGHDPNVATLFLCEGVAVYLDRHVLERLLRALRGAAAAGSRLAISLSVGGPGEPERDVRRRAFQAAVAAVGEPARTVLSVDDAEDLFARTGWRPLEMPARARYAGFVVVEPAGEQS